MIEAVALAFGVVFLAELGDKTQLMMLAFATRYRGAPVVAGLVAGSAIVMAASVLVGAALGTVMPTDLLQLAGGLVFLGFAAWTLLSREDNETDEAEALVRQRARARSALTAAGIVTTTFVLTELGDKSMLAAIAISAQADPLGTWAGAVLAEIAAGLLAIVVGRQLGARLRRDVLRYASAAAFAVFGLLLLVEASAHAG